MTGFMRKPQMINDPNAAPAAMRADDVDLQAETGDFIMGYPAMQQSGPKVRSLVEQAMLRAKDKGVKIKAYKHGDKVDILVHNGEMHIPNELVNHIDGGYTTLKELNKPSKSGYRIGDYITDRQAMNKEMLRRENLRRYIDPNENITARDYSISGDREREAKKEKQRKLEVQARLHKDGVHKDEPKLNDYKYEYQVKEMLDPKPKIAVHHPVHGSVVFAGDNPKGKMAWEKADKTMKSIFRGPHFDNKPKKANIMLYKEAMNNLKRAIENGIDHKSKFSSNKLINKQFLYNVAKSTETAHLLNKANFISSGKWLIPEFTVSETGIKVNYKNGTPAIMGRGIEEKNYIDDTDRTLRYKFDESFNKKDNWHKNDGMKFEAKHNIRDSQINSSGGTGYDGKNHTIKFNKDYNDVFNYLKQDNIEGFSPIIYDDEGHPAIGYGHRLTKNEIEKYKDGITKEEAEDLLAKDIMEAEKNVRVVYNKFIKDKGYTGTAATKFKDLDSAKRAILVEMAFNMGASKISPNNPKGFPKFFEALAHNDYETMKIEYHRKGVSEERNTEFLDTFIKPLSGEFNLKKMLNRWF